MHDVERRQAIRVALFYLMARAENEGSFDHAELCGLVRRMGYEPPNDEEVFNLMPTADEYRRAMKAAKADEVALCDAIMAGSVQ